MQIVAVIVSLLLIFVIAAVVIGREVNRLVDQAPRPVFDVDEAVEWVAERLAFEVSAVLSYEELRFILLAYLDELARRTESLEADVSRDINDDLVVADEEVISLIVVHAGEAGLELSEVHIRAVLAQQVAYLQAIGAAGSPQGL